jgi:hypothetical protein
MDEAMRVEAWSFPSAQRERPDRDRRSPVRRILTSEIVLCNNSGRVRVNQGGAA